MPEAGTGYRGVVLCAALALVAVVIGVTAVIADEAALGLVAAVVGVAAAARDEDVDLVGLSVLSGSHRTLVPETVELLRANGVDAPVVVGGIIPEADQPELLAAGVARVYTPKDFQVTTIMGDIVDLVAERHGAAAPA